MCSIWTMFVSTNVRYHIQGTLNSPWNSLSNAYPFPLSSSALASSASASTIASQRLTQSSWSSSFNAKMESDLSGFKLIIYQQLLHPAWSHNQCCCDVLFCCTLLLLGIRMFLEFRKPCNSRTVGRWHWMWQLSWVRDDEPADDDDEHVRLTMME